MALLIALPFAAGGRPLVLIVLAALSALLAANMALFARRYTRSPWIALTVALGLSLTAPLLTFSPAHLPRIAGRALRDLRAAPRA
ncbi:MAG: hypothetical protein KatS3mg059_0820 [Thermomicrobiales bacterium]|nr:MAG: hypothetical protein KatS3mg059_0820 [Thermomicrobiales bacterium]